MTNLSTTLPTKEEKLEKHFIELDYLYLTMQNDRGDKLFGNIKDAYNLSYSELNVLYNDFKRRKITT